MHSNIINVFGFLCQQIIFLIFENTPTIFFGIFDKGCNGHETFRLEMSGQFCNLTDQHFRLSATRKPDLLSSSATLTSTRTGMIQVVLFSASALIGLGQMDGIDGMNHAQPLVNNVLDLV